MEQPQSALYSPYGAYELKSKYQFNFLMGTVITAAAFALILISAWVIANWGDDDLEAIDLTSRVIKTVADLGPPPSVAKKPPQVQVTQPNVAAPKVGIPTPVADDEVLDEDDTIATRDELAEIVAPDVSDMMGGEGEIVVDIADDDYLPAPDEFVAVEIYPEIVHKEVVPYPKFAKDAELTGTVWLKLLVDEDQNRLNQSLAELIGKRSITPAMGSSLINDSVFAHDICMNLISAAQTLFVAGVQHPTQAAHDVVLDKSDLTQIGTQAGRDNPGS